MLAALYAELSYSIRINFNYMVDGSCLTIKQYTKILFLKTNNKQYTTGILIQMFST